MYDYHSRSHSPRSPILARAVGRSSAVSPLPPSWTPPASLPRTGLNASPVPLTLALLRSRREWPRRRAAEQRDELAPRHSITLSAATSSLSGTVRPSALAVFRLMTSSNLVGNSSGKSLGLAPLRILSTKPAERRKLSAFINSIAN